MVTRFLSFFLSFWHGERDWVIYYLGAYWEGHFFFCEHNIGYRACRGTAEWPWLWLPNQSRQAGLRILMLLGLWVY